MFGVEQRTRMVCETGFVGASVKAYSVVDVDRGDVLFDVAALPGGRYLALGTTGYGTESIRRE